MYWDHIFQLVPESEWAGWQKCSHAAWRCFSSKSLSISLSLPAKPHFAKKWWKPFKKRPKPAEISKGQVHEKKEDTVVFKNADDLCNDRWLGLIFLRPVSNGFYLCLLWYMSSAMESSIFTLSVHQRCLNNKLYYYYYYIVYYNIYAVKIFKQTRWM